MTWEFRNTLNTQPFLYFGFLRVFGVVGAGCFEVCGSFRVQGGGCTF